MKKESTPVSEIPNLEKEDKAIEELILSLFDIYGYDFRNYSKAHVKRRVLNRMRLLYMDSIDELNQLVVTETEIAYQLIGDLSITVTEMFRDPEFYVTIRKEIIPLLKTWSYLRIWHAGCSTGEEVYSMAILLKEAGLLNRTQIYATDFNQEALKRADDGIYAFKDIQKYAVNYRTAGGEDEFSKYYSAQYDSAIINKELKERIVWADHNLVTDSDFAEVHLVFCRNVLIYFNRELQNQVHETLFKSLVRGGVLCLGNKENIRFTEYENHYDVISNKHRIYKKKYS